MDSNDSMSSLSKLEIGQRSCKISQHFQFECYSMLCYTELLYENPSVDGSVRCVHNLSVYWKDTVSVFKRWIIWWFLKGLQTLMFVFCKANIIKGVCTANSILYIVAESQYIMVGFSLGKIYFLLLQLICWMQYSEVLLNQGKYTPQFPQSWG